MEAIYQRDSDQDGLTDAQELALGTNPLRKGFTRHRPNKYN